jgi:hypothetical protein
MWKMASDSFDTLREVVVRSSQTGRLRVDLALLGREKQFLLARLGEQVTQLIDEGKLQVPESARQTYDRVKDVDARIKADAGRAHDNAYGAPRGYEPEAGGYGDADSDGDGDGDGDLDGEDEHAEVARERKR